MQNVSHLSTAEQENHKNYLYAEMRKRYSVPEQGLINIKITEGTHGKLAEAGIVQLFERLNNESKNDFELMFQEVVEPYWSSEPS